MSNRTEYAHPSVDQLRTFGLGQLGTEEASVVEEHISHCESCCRTLAQVGPDTLLDLLRAARPAPDAQGATVAPTEAVPAGNLVLAAQRESTSAESSDAPAPLGLPPELVAHPRYRVLALLGAGGMGAVYKSEHRLMERLVALKVMNRALVGGAASVERFRREVRTAARLSHPNIVAAYDAEQAGDLHFLVMEYVEGTDLARVVAERGPLPIAEACDYVRQAAAGLQDAHEHGMIHRDIKPHNLMLTPQGVVKILDFGLARLAGDAGSQPGVGTAQGTVLGTVDYMAPEQADDARRADIRSDIYSLGCTLYHLLSGRPPYPKGTLVQKIMAHTERPAQSLLELRPDLPPGLARVVERMMAKPPSQRYQTPAELRIALEPFAEAAVTVVEPTTRRSPPLPPRPTVGGRAERTPAQRRPPRDEVILDALPARSGSRRGRLIALALLALALGGLIAGGAAVYRIQTDNGELVITTDNPDVEVVIKQNGKIVRIVDTKTNKEVTLDSGRYELELKDKAEGLKLSPAKFALRRGDTVVARVERLLPKPTPAVAVKPPEPPGEISHVDWNNEEGVPAHIYHATFAPNGRYFLGAGDAGVRSPVRVYNSTSGQLVSEFAPTEDEGWTGASFSPDSTKVVSWGHLGKVLHLWDAATGKELHKLEGHTEACSGTFSPDGKRIVSGSADKTLRIWDAATGKELLKLEGHTDPCQGTFSPDGKLVLSFSGDKTMRAWDAQTGKEVWKQEGQVNACVFSLLPYQSVFSPDGTQVLSVGGEGGIRLWETATGKAVRELKANADTQRAHFLPGGRQLVSWGKDNTLRVWDVASGKEVSQLALGDDANTSANPDALAVSPDGRLVLVVHNDTTVRVHDLATGKELHRYQLAGLARSVAFSPDSRFAAAGSFRVGVYLWRLPAPPGK